MSSLIQFPEPYRRLCIILELFINDEFSEVDKMKRGQYVDWSSTTSFKSKNKHNINIRTEIFITHLKATVLIRTFEMKT